MIEIWRHVTKDLRADIVVLDMPVLGTRGPKKGVTRTLITVLQLLSYVAQIKRESIKRRQAKGLASAKTRSGKFGRPRNAKPSNWKQTHGDFRQTT